MNLDWSIISKNIPEEACSELADTLDYWLENDFEYENGYFFVSFCTESFRDQDDIEDALLRFTKEHPGISVSAYYKQDVEECPDKMKFRDGAVRNFVGITKYFEFDPQTGQTSETPDEEDD